MEYQCEHKDICVRKCQNINSKPTDSELVSAVFDELRTNWYCTVLERNIRFINVREEKLKKIER